MRVEKLLKMIAARKVKYTKKKQKKKKDTEIKQNTAKVKTYSHTEWHKRQRAEGVSERVRERDRAIAKRKSAVTAE